MKLSLQTTIGFIFSKTVDRLIGFSIHLSGSGHGVACDVFRCLAKHWNHRKFRYFESKQSHKYYVMYTYAPFIDIIDHIIYHHIMHIYQITVSIVWLLLAKVSTGNSPSSTSRFGSLPTLDLKAEGNLTFWKTGRGWDMLEWCCELTH